MAVLKIETGKNNKILRTISKEVPEDKITSKEIQNFINDMKETLSLTKNGIGLAAPQVGKNLRIFIASDKLKINQTVFINPKIIKISDKKVHMEEGCLSLPDEEYAQVPRAEWVKIEAINQNGRKFKMKAKKLIAQLIQHEIDHLNGTLYTDKAIK